MGLCALPVRLHRGLCSVITPSVFAQSVTVTKDVEDAYRWISARLHLASEGTYEQEVQGDERGLV